MKVCPSCGYTDNPYWRHSRFDYNADYMRYEDFREQFPNITQSENSNIHNPLVLEGYTYYRRGTGGLEVYRVANEDFRMPRERKNHKAVPVK
jgi:hypothetical protein